MAVRPDNSEITTPLRGYLAANALLGLGLFLAALRHPVEIDPLAVATLTLFTGVCAVWRVELTIFQAKMTLTYAAVCLALVTQGLPVAVCMAVLGALLGSYLKPGRPAWKVTIGRPALYRTVFNAANCATTCYLSSLPFHAILKALPQSDEALVVALIAFTSSYFVLNTVGVSAAIAIQTRSSLFSVWKSNFLWTAPGYFVSASAAATYQLVERYVGIWALTVLPWLYVVFYSYRLYMDRIRQDMSHIQQLNQLNQAIIASLATAIDAKDRFTCSHILRVRHYAVSLAAEMGLTGPELDAVATGSLVHDIGKLGIPDHILSKPGKLSPDEHDRIKSHVTIGAEILAPIPFPFPLVDIVLTHHERWDGQGYPRGLRGEEIPIGGRIVALVDVFDALTSERPYRKALDEVEAVEAIRQEAGRAFDPELVERFVAILPRLRREVEEMDAAQSEAAAMVRSEHEEVLAQIGQAGREAAALYDVARSLSELSTLEEVLEFVPQRALQSLPVDAAVLFMRTPGEPLLLAMAAAGRHADRLSGMTIQLGEGLTGRVGESRRAHSNAGAALDVARRFGPDENVELSLGSAVPLVHGGECLGVLTVYSTAYRRLDDHHLSLMNLLAEHAATAIQNVRRWEQHRELAYTDPLTGLANSRCLVRQLTRLTHPESNEVSSTRQAPFAVIMLDLDCFKQVNDRYGHLRGDELLRQVAEVLVKNARPGDLVSRYAGDEFVLLLPETGRTEAERTAARIQMELGLLSQVAGVHPVGASAGVAAYPEDGLTEAELMKTADYRMYQDKARRSTVRPTSAAQTSTAGWR